jgi:hypothetical protein
MGILSEMGKGRGPCAGSIAPVIGHDQVHLLLVVKSRDLIIITHHLPIPVEK